MVYLKKNLVIFLTVLFTAALFSPSALAGDEDNSSGTPPYGVTGDGHAYGTKLSGALSLSMTDLDNVGVGPVSYVMRLRNKNVLQIFVGETEPADYAVATDVQAAIAVAVREDVLTAFGFDPGLSTLVLKSADEYIDTIIEGDLYCPGPEGPWVCGTKTVAVYAVMDIVFAAN